MGGPGQMGRKPPVCARAASFALDGGTCGWLKPDPCHKSERAGTWTCGNYSKVMASLPLARWHGGCLHAR
jgi:hypothetical protein